MTINQKQYEEAYRSGRELHAGTIGISQAKKRLEVLGVNPNSSADLVYGVKHLLNGHRYTRTLSAPLIEDYLKWIQRDYGKTFLKNAVSALRQHIEYYQSLTQTPMRGHVKVLQKFSELVDDENAEFISPEEIDEQDDEHVEGGTKTIVVNIYERNRKARTLCIAKYGYVCFVCGFDFEKKYGAIGKDFIHVHHVRDLASIGKAYKVDPISDLRPVCPNCHAMLHKSKPCYTVDELRKLMAAQQSS